MTSKKRVVLFLVLIFTSFLILLESTYRAYQYLAYGVPVFNFLSDDSTDEVSIGGATSIAIANPLLHYVLNPDRPSHTKDHFRITESIDSPKYTVVCMGGSSTYGTGLPASKAYPAQLQQLLNNDSKKYKILNAGVPGWSLPHHIARYIFDLRNRSPAVDLVVLYIGYNDSWQNITNGQTAIGHSDRFKTFPTELPIWMNSRVLLWLIPKFEVVLERNLAPTHLNSFAFVDRIGNGAINPQNVVRFKKELDLLLKIMKADGVMVLVVLQDSNWRHGTQKDSEAFNFVRSVIETVATLNQTKVVDMHKVLKSKDEYFIDYIHMNELGSNVMADHLASVIKAMF